MRCPVCKTPMIVVERESVELDYCVQCGGTWFDRDELELLMAGMGAEAVAAVTRDLADLPPVRTDEPARRCPLCRRRMRKGHLGGPQGVLIDACPRGEGLWFDDAEVARLARAIAESLPQVHGTALAFMERVFGGPGGADTDRDNKEV